MKLTAFVLLIIGTVGLWPLTSLERLAKEPDTLSVELTSDEIRHWQRDVVASSLQACLS
ncbi:unnamed protein product [marine sediment metagenome]|uniref:Uncharacterized protein n=1 Tax=marine sediment metagenome TaxID=412755 RepID=X1T3M8_9ZZZZ